jgi:hypothetical protein
MPQLLAVFEYRPSHPVGCQAFLDNPLYNIWILGIKIVI